MKAIDVVILCGGQGSRLRPVVSDRPKPMAEIQGRPFLDILIDHVSSFGLKRFILCTGFMADSIERYYEDAGKRFTMLFSRETSPLGTGGAVKKAGHLISSEPFLVMNGDSFCPVDIATFIDFHLSKKASISLVASQVENSGDYGFLVMDGESRIISFREKVSSLHKLVNAGIYLMDKSVLSIIPFHVTYSLERDLFPGFIGHDFFGYTTHAELIDIGTPERYEEAKRSL